MILYEGGEDIPIRGFNSSKVYYTGSRHKTSQWGIVTIVAQENRYYTAYNKGTPCKSYIYFIVQFEDETKVQARMGYIKEGLVKNPNSPNVYSVGFAGQGEYTSKTHPKEYAIWERMLERCYSEKRHKNQPTYKDCTVDERWYNFQNFCEDIIYLDRYKDWKSDNNKRNKYELDKDIKIKGNKVYSKNTCSFVSQHSNKGRYNKKQPLTGLTYIGTRISDNFTEEFINQTEFADKYHLNKVYVCRCCNNKLKTTGGWKFSTKRKEK
jgi:hypothetical protein